MIYTCADCGVVVDEICEDCGCCIFCCECDLTEDGEQDNGDWWGDNSWGNY